MFKKELKNLVKVLQRGGQGSGNQGHTGRQGTVGGSKNRDESKKDKYRQGKYSYTLVDLINALKRKE